MARALGLVAGAGALPGLVAVEARRAGWRVVALALDPADRDAPDLAADRVVPCRLGDVGPVLQVLGEEGIRHVVLAGRVTKGGLFRGMTLDAPGRDLLDRASDWTDDGLLGAAARALGAMGVEVLDQREFLAPWMAPAGLMAGPPLTPPVSADVARGLEVAREIARRGIGQTVVLRHGSIAAVEAMEGTDEAIRRGLGLAGRGTVVVKATSPSHDYRFDVPTIGPATLAACAAGGVAALAVEAGRVLLMERKRMEAEAAGAGISLVGVPESREH